MSTKEKEQFKATALKLRAEGRITVKEETRSVKALQQRNYRTGVKKRWKLT